MRRDQVEADMSEMSSMSESEIHAVMKEQASKKQEDQRKFLKYRSNTRGDLEWHFRCRSYLTFPLLILSHITPSCAATCSNRNLIVDDCAAVALERIEPDG